MRTLLLDDNKREALVKENFSLDLDSGQKNFSDPDISSGQGSHGQTQNPSFWRKAQAVYPVPRQQPTPSGSQATERLSLELQP